MLLTASMVGLAAAPAARAQCPSSFAAAVNYGAGSLPTFVAIGDLNGDGKLDLVVANSGGSLGNDVSVLLGNGDGTFQPRVNYAVGSPPYSVAIQDVNADDRPDLATANFSSNTVSLLLGNGDGTFAPAVSYSTGIEPRSIAIGDFNGDGRPDLATANYMGNNVSVLQNNGNGTFAAAVNYTVGSNPYSIVIGDVNADGYLDLAVANYMGDTISVLRGNGNGTFATALSYVAGNRPRALAIGDVSGDGRPDLVVANEFSNNVSVLLCNINGSFAAPINCSTGNGPTSVTIADVNADGRPDLATANGGPPAGNDVSVLLGNGNGIFAPAVDYNTGGWPSSVAIGDLNGDHKPDLAVANLTNSNVFVLVNNGKSIVITQQPVGQAVTEGQDAVFSVTTIGGPAYRWRRDGTPLVNGGRFSGVTTSVLTITGVVPADAGVYDVQIIVIPCNAAVLSRPVMLNVTNRICKGDFNNDNEFNAADIQSIVDALLIGQTCP